MRRAALFFVVFASGCPNTPDPEPKMWRVEQEHLPSALLRVYGTSANDVFAVGADADGTGPIVLHYDGVRWDRLATGARDGLWWIEAAGSTYRMVGENGLVLRYEDGVFEERRTPGRETLFGAWSPEPGRWLYVGGDVSAQRGVLYEERAGNIALVDTATDTPVLFKVHGTPDGTIMMVGQQGYTASFDGLVLSPKRIATRAPLLTVHGRARDRLYAVGGVADGLLLRFDGESWIDETQPETPGMNGVWAVDAEHAFAAGFNGRIYQRDENGWRELEGVPTYLDLHSVWIDPDGGLWAAGGLLGATPPKDGVLVRWP